MNSVGIKKFRNISFGVSSIGILASIIFWAILSSGHYFDCTVNGGSEAYCKTAYFANASYGKIAYYGFFASFLVALLGIVFLIVWIVLFFISRNSQNAANQTPEQIELHEAEKEYAKSVKEAEKTYKTKIKTLEKAVKQAENAVKAAEEMGKRKLGKFRSVTLYEDRVETPQGTALFEDGKIDTEASPNGSLKIHTSALQCLVEGKPEQFDKAREFTGNIQAAFVAYPKIKEEKLKATSQATSELEESQTNLSAGSSEAETDLENVKADTARVDMAKSVLDRASVPSENA